MQKRFVQLSRSDADGDGDGESSRASRRSSLKISLLVFILSPSHSVSGREKDDVGLRLYRAALAGDLVAMATALAQGAEVNGSIGEEAGRTALIGAAVGVKDQ